MESSDRLIASLANNPGWKELKDWIGAQINFEIEKMLRAKKDETFRDRQGAVNAYKKIINRVDNATESARNHT